MTSFLDNLAMFSKIIVSRGEEYYKQGKVLSFTRDGNIVSAKVEGSGSKTYEVTLTFKKTNAMELASSYCSCPYYDDCKHIVAVLFALEKDRLSSSSFSGALTPDLFASSLRNYEVSPSRVSLSLLIRQLDSLLRFGVFEKKKEFFVDCYIRLIKTMALNSNRYYETITASRQLDDMLPLAGIDSKAFVPMAITEAIKKDVLTRNMLFAHFLESASLYLDATDYFLSGYEKDEAKALSLLGAMNRQIPQFLLNRNERFIVVLLDKKPSLLPSDSFNEFIMMDNVLSNPLLLEKTLEYFVRNGKRGAAFYNALEKFLSMGKKEECLSFLEKMLLRSEDYSEDAYFVFRHFSKEEAIKVYSSNPFVKYAPIFPFVSFMAYPEFGEFNKNSLPMELIYRLWDKLDEEKKQYALALAHSLAMKKKHTAKEAENLIASLLILSLNGDKSALGVINDPNNESTFRCYSSVIPGVSLLLKERLMDEGDRDYIVYKGDQDVSL